MRRCPPPKKPLYLCQAHVKLSTIAASIDFDDDDDDCDENDAADGVKRHLPRLKALSLRQQEVTEFIKSTRLNGRHQRHRPKAEEVEEDA